MEAASGYVPEVYGGNAVLLHADLPERDGLAMAWEALIEGGVEAHALSGDHYTLLAEPHVQALAQRLDGYLSQSGMLPAAAVNAAPRRDGR